MSGTKHAFHDTPGSVKFTAPSLRIYSHFTVAAHRVIHGTQLTLDSERLKHQHDTRLLFTFGSSLKAYIATQPCTASYMKGDIYF